MARLKNVCGGIRGFFGSAKMPKFRPGKIQTLRLNPGETVELTAEQENLLKSPKDEDGNPNPHYQVLQHFLKVKDLVDVDGVFGGPREYVAADDAPSFDEVLEQHSSLKDLNALKETEALEKVSLETDLDTLKAWYMADTRQAVKDQINARGRAVKAAAAANA